MTLSPEQLAAIRRSAESDVHWGSPGVRAVGQATLVLLDEIDRLRATCQAWMNGVADVVEPFGFDRHAASGPADLLPGLATLTDENKALRAAALEVLLAQHRKAAS